MEFIEEIKGQAKKSPRTIVLPEGDEERIIKAVEVISKENIARIILLGDKDAILSVAKKEGVESGGIFIINPLTSEKRELYAHKFYELRKEKGVSLDESRELLKDAMYYATMMVYSGDADGVVSGAAHPTSWTLRPPLQVFKRTRNIKTVSAYFVMVVPDCPYGEKGLFIFADCGMVPNPNAEQLAEIAIVSAETARGLIGVEPRVAMLSFSTKGSGKDPIVDKIIKATSIAQRRRPDLLIDGELQGDSALVPSIGRKKAPASPVAGRANVLIFPDLNCGNIVYKLTERLARAQAYGPLVQGLDRPVNDLSRGCSVQDIVGVVAITVVQSQILGKQRTKS
ncbi:MAG: phosphate acetyltransferase [Candidatus Aerophobetes bacterium]|nr:phosphate acetyltransferase [Candidatus Aerophobetes bacterium]